MYNNYLEQSLSQCKLHTELFLLLWLLLLLTIYYLQYLYSPIGQFREGSGNPLQHSCLENPMDGEAWRAMVRGVAESWTRLKWLSTHTHIAQLVKNPPAMQKTLVQFLGQEHPLEKDLLQILQWYWSITPVILLQRISRKISGEGSSPDTSVILKYHSSIPGLPLWLSW